MPTVTTRPIEDERPQDATLHVAFDLGNTEWTLACAPAVAAPPRIRTMPPVISRAWSPSSRRPDGTSDCPRPRRFAPATRRGATASGCIAPVASAGVLNVIVDSASIEVNRRARQAKTDRLDATALLRLLLRYTAGETQVWRVVHVPTVDEEDGGTRIANSSG